MSTIEDKIWVDDYKKGRDLFRKYSIMKYSHLFSSQKCGKIIIDIGEDIAHGSHTASVEEVPGEHGNQKRNHDQYQVRAVHNVRCALPGLPLVRHV